MTESPGRVSWAIDECVQSDESGERGGARELHALIVDADGLGRFRARVISAPITSAVPATDAAAGSVPKNHQPNSIPKIGPVIVTAVARAAPVRARPSVSANWPMRPVTVTARWPRTSVRFRGIDGAAGRERADERARDHDRREPEEDRERMLLERPFALEAAHRDVREAGEDRSEHADDRILAEPAARTDDAARRRASATQHEPPMPAAGRSPTGGTARARRRRPDGCTGAGPRRRSAAPGPSRSSRTPRRSLGARAAAAASGACR